MLGKLFKYDFKWINRVMPIYYILLIIISIATKIVEYLLNNDGSLLLVIVDKILVAMFIGCSVSIMITCIMRIWVRFINNIYKDESYLTHTLPVTRNQIFNSKILAGILSLLISASVIVFCVVFVYISNDTIDSIKMMWDSLVATYNNFSAVLIVVGIILLITLEIIYMMMAGIFGITIGHCFNNFKILKSVIIGIGSYSLLSFMSLIVVVIISNFIDFDIIGNGFPTINYIRTTGIASLTIYLVFNIVYYFIAKKVFNMGVNVD